VAAGAACGVLCGLAVSRRRRATSRPLCDDG
jgi:hypothetical protein